MTAIAASEARHRPSSKRGIDPYGSPDQYESGAFGSGGEDGLAKEAQRQAGERSGRETPRGCRKQAQARPRCRRDRDDSRRTVGRIYAAYQNQPEVEERSRAPNDGSARQTCGACKMIHGPFPLIEYFTAHREANCCDRCQQN
jgi:hypothetical protein